MHCNRDAHIPLKDTSSETVKYSFMDCPDLAKKKAHSQSADSSNKQVHTRIVPNENDILLGRGGKNNMHVGNERLRELARKVAEKYHVSSKKEKSFLSRTLVEQVKELDPPGRFLRRHPKENYWEDMTEDEDKCREKCAQVLRDAVAFVGLKDAPEIPTMTQREQEQELQAQRELELQQNVFAIGRYPMANSMHSMHPLMQQPPMHIMGPNPFAMSASSSSQILQHQQRLLASQNRASAASRQLSFQHFHGSQMGRNSLAPSAGTYEPASLSSYAAMPPSVPQSIQMQPGWQDASFRVPKRRRLSNSVLDPFATLPGEAMPFGAFDRRLSIASNSYPVGSDFQQGGPGPRARRDSLMDNLSLGLRGSDHSGPSLRDFELIPDIAETAPEIAGDCDVKNDNDEFASDFY